MATNKQKEKSVRAALTAHIERREVFLWYGNEILSRNGNGWVICDKKSKEPHVYTRHVHIAIYNILYVLPFSFFRFSDSIREMQQSQSVVGVVWLPLLVWPNQYMEQF